MYVNCNRIKLQYIGKILSIEWYLLGITTLNLQKSLAFRLRPPYAERITYPTNQLPHESVKKINGDFRNALFILVFRSVWTENSLKTKLFECDSTVTIIMSGKKHNFCDVIVSKSSVFKILSVTTKPPSALCRRNLKGGLTLKTHQMSFQIGVLVKVRPGNIYFQKLRH